MQRNGNISDRDAGCLTGKEGWTDLNEIGLLSSSEQSITPLVTLSLDTGEVSARTTS